MGFEPVHDNHNNIKVRVERTDDVRKILDRHQGCRDDVAQPGRSASPTSKRSSSGSQARRSARVPSVKGGIETARRRRKSRLSVKSFYRERTAMFFTLAFPIILILVSEPYSWTWKT